MNIIDPKHIKKFEQLIKDGKTPVEALKKIQDEINPKVKEEIRVYGPKPMSPKPYSPVNWEIPPADDRKKK